MRHCECIPWDYPTPFTLNGTNDMMICDFYGSSCFNSYIENGLAEKCKKECVPGCNEIKFTMTTEERPIEWEKICSYDPNDFKIQLDLFEIEISNYIRNSTYQARAAMEHFQEALGGFKDSESYLTNYCKDKLLNDMAIVEVVMDSPTAIKYIQSEKATFSDMLGSIGKFAILKRSFESRYLFLKNFVS